MNSWKNGDWRRILPAAAMLCAIACTGTANAQEGRRGGPGGFGRGGSAIRFNPALAVLDADGNGTISAAEIDQATARLRSLDKNNDGQLSSDELRPNFEGMRGPGGRGPGERGPGGGNNAEEIVNTLMGFDGNGDGKLAKSEVPERMQGLFERGDANKDGLLTREELTAAAAAQAGSSGGPGRGGEREGRRGGMPGGNPVVAALDADRDGILSSGELSHAPEGLRKLDSNGDGQITDDEVRPAGPPAGRGNPEEMIAHLFEEYDKNGDGKLAKNEAPERLQMLFDRADEDRDGFLTREEVRKAFERGPGRN